MKQYLVTIRCENPSVIRTIGDENGKIIEKGIEHNGVTLCFHAIVNQTLLAQIERKAQVEIHGDIAEIGKKHQSLVGKGNRYT